MTPIIAIEPNSSALSSTDKHIDCDILYQELSKGIQSMKNGDIYTIDEAWEEIDKI